MNRDYQQQVETSIKAERFSRRGRGKWLGGLLWVGLFVGSVLVGVSVYSRTDVGFAKDSPTEQADAAQLQIAHGKYLVHHVAQCIQCHTPRDAQGDLIESRLLTGASIPVVGPKYCAPWAAESVDLAGLGNYSVSFVRHLLIHGKRPDGTKPKSPMPTFNLSQSDADAVIAYLKSK